MRKYNLFIYPLEPIKDIDKKSKRQEGFRVGDETFYCEYNISFAKALKLLKMPIHTPDNYYAAIYDSDIFALYFSQWKEQGRRAINKWPTKKEEIDRRKYRAMIYDLELNIYNAYREEFLSVLDEICKDNGIDIPDLDEYWWNKTYSKETMKKSFSLFTYKNNKHLLKKKL